MLTSDLVRLYPSLFHTAADGSWPSIRELGLLSTAAMLELWEVEKGHRRELLTTVRRESTVIEHRVRGPAVVRDQGTIHAPSLEECLIDVTVEQWLQILNERVFFFLQRGQVDGLVGARQYRGIPKVVLEIDTASLVAVYEERIELCRINSGYAQRHNKSPRGRDTFVRIAGYPHPWREQAVRAERPDVKELTVLGDVPDIVEHVRSVQRVVGGEVVEHLPI